MGYLYSGVVWTLLSHRCRVEMAFFQCQVVDVEFGMWSSGFKEV